MKTIDIIPPLLLDLRQRLLRALISDFDLKKLKSKKLFDGDDKLFKHQLSLITKYAEIGAGQSTVFSCLSTNIKEVVAVDTSNEYLNKIKKIYSGDKLKTHFVDFGEIGDWGRPTSYQRIDKIKDYSELVFQNFDPELLLLDGRFRVYCFLKALLIGKPGLKIIFDDYSRPNYHIVEKFLKPIEINSRQALFIINDKIDKLKVQKFIENFKYVMD